MDRSGAGARLLDDDGDGAVIINQWLAAQFFPGEDPIGKRLRLRERGTAPAAPWLTIVGISPSIRHGNMREVGPTPAAYLPYAQHSPSAVSLLVRRVDISPADPITFAAITALLTIVSVAACLVPARQATRVDPVEALRAE